MTAWIVENNLKWRALNPFGAEVDHDLAEPLAPETARRFAALVWEAGLVIAHRQRLSMPQQQRLLSLLGPILQRAGETGYMSTSAGNAASLSELTFHADAAYTTAPFDALSLHAIEVIDDASSTRFVSAERAYATLPSELRERLAACTVEMISPSFATLGQWSCDIREHTPMRSAQFPSIHVNPHTQRPCVWVSQMHAARLVEMSWEDSRATLHAVYDHLYAPENSYEHRWCNGDLVIWDNIGLQHARGSLQGVGPRTLQRVIVGTEGVCPQVPQSYS